MADPATMMLVATAVSTTGQIVGAVGQYQTANYNAGLMEQSANVERANATIEAENIVRETRKDIGAATARAGASGFALSGTASDVIAQIAGEGYQGARTAAYTGMIRGRSLSQRAKQTRSDGKLGLTLGLAKAGSTALTGASDYRRMAKTAGAS